MENSNFETDRRRVTWVVGWEGKTLSCAWLCVLPEKMRIPAQAIKRKQKSSNSYEHHHQDQRQGHLPIAFFVESTEQKIVDQWLQRLVNRNYSFQGLNLPSFITTISHHHKLILKSDEQRDVWLGRGGVGVDAWWLGRTICNWLYMFFRKQNCSAINREQENSNPTCSMIRKSTSVIPTLVSWQRRKHRG